MRKGMLDAERQRSEPRSVVTSSVGEPDGCNKGAFGGANSAAHISLVRLALAPRIFETGVHALTTPTAPRSDIPFVVFFEARGTGPENDDDGPEDLRAEAGSGADPEVESHARTVTLQARPRRAAAMSALSRAMTSSR